MSAIKAGSKANWIPLCFVWTLWLVLAVFLVRFVQAFGVDFPYFDEWELIPALTGNQPITLGWLWSQHNEHRIFLPRLIYLALMKLCGNDFRAGMFFDAFALIVCSAALLVVAHRQRGRAQYSDAFFPLLLLNLGQAQNLVNGFQIAFVAATLIVVPLLVWFVRPGRLGFRPALAAGVCTLSLALVGGHGVSLVPSLVLCALISAWRIRREAHGVRKAWAIVALAGLASALGVFYFVSYQRPLKHPVSPTVAATLNGAMQFLTGGFGSATRLVWSELREPFIAIVVASLAALLTLASRPAERDRALRLALLLGAFVSLALGTSWARSALGPDALFASRYCALAAPFWCALYFVWELGQSRQLQRLAQMSLFFCAAALALPNYWDGAGEAVYFRDVRRTAASDLARGVPLEQLVARHHQALYYGDPLDLTAHMLMLHQKQIGVFRRLRK